MAVARNADGRMEVFGRGTDRALIHNWQVGPNTNWANQWMSLGFHPDGRLRSVPAVGRNVGGRLEVFAVGNNDSIWHISQTAPNNGWSGWEPLGRLAGTLGPASDTDAFPTVGQNADGRLQVFVGRPGLPTAAAFAVLMTWPSGTIGGWSVWAGLSSWAVHSSGGLGRGLIEP